MAVRSFQRRIWHEARVYTGAVRRFRPNTQRYLIGLAFLAPGTSLFTLLYNLYLLELGFTAELVGQVAAATAFGIMLGGIPGGMIYSRLGGRSGFLISIVAMAAAQLAQVLVRTPSLLLLAALSSGASQALFFSVMHPFMAEESDDRDRTYLFTVNGIFWSVSGMVGSLVGGVMPPLLISIFTLPSLLVGQRSSMLFGTAFLTLALIPTLMMKTAPRKPQPVAVTASPQAQRPSWRGFIGASVIIFFFGLATGSSLPFFNVYLRQFHGAATGQIGLVIGLAQLGGGLALLVLPTLVNRLGKVKIHLAFGVIAAPLFILLGSPLILPLAAVSFLMVTALYQANANLYYVTIMEVVRPHERSRMTSVRIFINYMASSLAGLLGGWMIVNQGYGSLFTVAAAMSIAAGTATWLFFRHSPAAKPIQ